MQITLASARNGYRCQEIQDAQLDSGFVEEKEVKPRHDITAKRERNRSQVCCKGLRLLRSVKKFKPVWLFYTSFRNP